MSSGAIDQAGQAVKSLRLPENRFVWDEDPLLYLENHGFDFSNYSDEDKTNLREYLHAMDLKIPSATLALTAFDSNWWKCTGCKVGIGTLIGGTSAAIVAALAVAIAALLAPAAAGAAAGAAAAGGAAAAEGAVAAGAAVAAEGAAAGAAAEGAAVAGAAGAAEGAAGGEVEMAALREAARGMNVAGLAQNAVLEGAAAGVARVAGLSTEQVLKIFLAAWATEGLTGFLGAVSDGVCEANHACSS